MSFRYYNNSNNQPRYRTLGNGGGSGQKQKTAAATASSSSLLWRQPFFHPSDPVWGRSSSSLRNNGNSNKNEATTTSSSSFWSSSDDGDSNKENLDPSSSSSLLLLRRGGAGGDVGKLMPLRCAANNKKKKKEAEEKDDGTEKLGGGENGGGGGGNAWFPSNWEEEAAKIVAAKAAAAATAAASETSTSTSTTNAEFPLLRDQFLDLRLDDGTGSNVPNDEAARSEKRRGIDVLGRGRGRDRDRIGTTTDSSNEPSSRSRRAFRDKSNNVVVGKDDVFDGGKDNNAVESGSGGSGSGGSRGKLRGAVVAPPGDKWGVVGRKREGGGGAAAVVASSRSSSNEKLATFAGFGSENNENGVGRIRRKSPVVLLYADEDVEDDEEYEYEDDDDDNAVPLWFDSNGSEEQQIGSGGAKLLPAFEFRELPSPRLTPRRLYENDEEEGGGDDDVVVADVNEQHDDAVLVTPIPSPAPRQLQTVTPESAERVVDLLPSGEHMIPRSKREYAEVITVLVEKAHEKNGYLDKAERLFCKMVDDFENGTNTARPDGGICNKIMTGFAKIGHADKVEELFQMMRTAHRKGCGWGEPNVKHYTTVIKAWQMSNLHVGPERCEELLDEMYRLHASGTFDNCRPDTMTYTAVLHCWADSRRDDAPARAEALFRRMKARFDDGDEKVRPDALTYSNLINAFVKNNGYERAEDLLWEMVDDYLKGNEDCKPPIRTLNTLLAAWSNSIVSYAAERAENMVFRWLKILESTDLDVKPDMYTYNLLLKCWYVVLSSGSRSLAKFRSKPTAHRFLTLLLDIVDLSTLSLPPLFSALSSRATSAHKDASERAYLILTWLDELAKKGDKAAALDDIKVSTCMGGWRKARSYHCAANFLTKTIEEYAKSPETAFLPQFKNFKNTVEGLCHAGAGARADELLRLVWTVQRKEWCHRSQESCLVVIQYWAKVGQPGKADDLLYRMQLLSNCGKINDYPNHVHYKAVIAAWENSRLACRRDRVQSLSQRMKDHKAKNERKGR